MTSTTLLWTALAVFAILVPASLLACGDGGLSRSDIQQIVQSELANNPAPLDQGSSREQVEQIVREAMAGESGQTSPGAAMSAPRKSTPDQFTRYFVNKALDMYESEGLDATVTHYNTKASMDGPWYVFIFDADDNIIAHAPDPSLVNGPASNAIGPNGFPAGDAVAASADEDGEWFSYTYPNPASGAIETKHSWVVRHDGLLFGSGWYERGPRRSDPPAYTQSFVQQAVNLYDAVGLEDTIAYYNSKESVDGQWYIVIFDENDTMRAHAPNPDLVNRPASYAIGPNGYPTGEAVVATADEDGAWFGYTYLNPATGGVETKHSWVVRHDGLTFGSGWYERGPNRSDAPAYTKSLVEQALNLYDALGLDATIEYYSSEESVDGQWYVFIIDGNGYTIAHPNPIFVGRDPSLRIDATGHFYGDDLLSATETGKWVDYVLINPETGNDRQKHTWAVLHDGYLFGSGWYE